MVYLIIVTVRTVPQLWDPYEVLGISRVCGLLLNHVYGIHTD